MERLVHVIPLGWEYDRVVLPVDSMKAHRVYLLSDPSENPLRAHYLRKVTRRLRAGHIEVKVVGVDTFKDLLGTMKSISRIIKLELAQGNRVFVNVATSGKIAAIAATLAAMAHLPPERGLVYYVAAGDYPSTRKSQLAHGIAKGMDGDPVPIPLFKIRLPDMDCRIVLAELSAAPDHTLAYRAMIEAMRSKGVSGFESPPPEGTDRRRFRTIENVRFYQRIVRKLEREALVSIVERGRARSLRLTLAGAQVASMCG